MHTDTDTKPTLKVAALRDRLYEAALEYLDKGFSIFPISIDSKVPLNAWRDYQTKAPTYEEITDWFENGAPTPSGERIKLFNIGLATGAVSGVVVVDADNQTALDYCANNGLCTAFSVKTTRGRHYYFSHPGGGARFGNKAGASALHDPDWPHVDGLDFRGDGGYVVLPPSIKLNAQKIITHEYTWDYGYSDDMREAPVWGGTKPMMRVIEPIVDSGKSAEEIFASLDLTHVRAQSEGDGLGVVNLVASRVKEIGEKLPNGSGRGTFVTRLIGELIVGGLDDSEIASRVHEFMDTYFATRLPDREWKATLRSLRHKDEREHGPRERKEESKVEVTKPVTPMTAFTDDQLEDLMASLRDEVYAVDPFLKHPSIVQVYGYTGHGKSWLTLLVLWHLAKGQSIGPFTIARPHTVAYVDFENGRSTIAHRMQKFLKSFGSTNKRLKIVSPAIQQELAEMNLKEPAGLIKLQKWIEATTPEVVVIDTVRSAYPGMQENSAEAWSPMNQLALKLRNAGISVIIVHHANKPQDAQTSSGMEAGSTNQLSVIEQQIRIVQMYEDEAKATAKRGKYLDPVRANMECYMKREEPTDRMIAAFEWSYGKVREMTDNHMDALIAFMEREDGSLYVVSSESPRQKAVRLSEAGKGAGIISRELQLPLYVVKKWVGEI
ncbi:Prim_Pol domain containing protein [uncultured Caudovirales phage]|uniref:Prim_Pol domain containing protein n=1 Tax=uncultured Caudovirales phage TaxID=2100421 RepID=A0A6J7WU44_9CAUD|nr:Prim_Pol domain containing protein [uncultured Caudovirales phage]